MHGRNAEAGWVLIPLGLLPGNHRGRLVVAVACKQENTVERVLVEFPDAADHPEMFAIGCSHKGPAIVRVADEDPAPLEEGPQKVDSPLGVVLGVDRDLRVARATNAVFLSALVGGQDVADGS